MKTEEIRQKLVNALQEQESLAKCLAHTFVKNIAHDEFDKSDAATLKDGINQLSQLTTDAHRHLRELISSGELK